MTRADDGARSGEDPVVRTDREREIQRAWIEPMTITRLDRRRWVVEDTTGVGHVVNLDRRECTCPVHAAGEAPCRHARRVAMGINGGRYSPPEPTTRRARGVEEDRTLAGEASESPGDRDLEAGTVVFDRERPAGPPMLVVGVTDERADEVPVPGDDRTVAEYGPNRRYSPSDPVVDVVYPHAVRRDVDVPTYSFPASRLEVRDDDDTIQTVLPGTDPGS